MKLHGLFQNAVKYREAVIFFLTLPTLGQNISAYRFFPDMRFVAVNSKYSLVSHIFELGIFNAWNKNVRKLLIWVPVGDCLSLTFSLLAKVFAKGKMFWYQRVPLPSGWAKTFSLCNCFCFDHWNHWQVKGAFIKKWLLRWPPRRNIKSEYPCAAAILAVIS